MLDNYNKNISENVMIGNVKSTTELWNGKQTSKLYIPLNFWFTGDKNGNFFPIYMFDKSDVKINIEFKQYDEL